VRTEKQLILAGINIGRLHSVLLRGQAGVIQTCLSHHPPSALPVGVCRWDVAEHRLVEALEVASTPLLRYGSTHYPVDTSFAQFYVDKREYKKAGSYDHKALAVFGDLKSELEDDERTRVSYASLLLSLGQMSLFDAELHDSSQTVSRIQ
jgi:hypothetical protein